MTSSSPTVLEMLSLAMSKGHQGAATARRRRSHGARKSSNYQGWRGKAFRSSTYVFLNEFRPRATDSKPAGILAGVDAPPSRGGPCPEPSPC